MESWDSSNTDQRLSDNSDINKEITVTDHHPSTNGHDSSSLHLPRSDYVLKHPTHPSLPIMSTSTIRPMVVPSSSSGYQTPPTNGRPLEAIRHSDSGDSIHVNERQLSNALNNFNTIHMKSNRSTNHYDTKYDNCCTTTTSASKRRTDTITLVLKRDRRILDFGFSISDRLYGTGVYVNKIRPHGPAELEGTLIPCMRIYQVNNIDVTRMECSQVVPLLSTSNDELTLVVGRRPAPMFDETDELFDVDEEDNEQQTHLGESLWNSSTHSTTKNNNNNFTLLSQSKTSTV